jgi:hypothetical protein
MGCDQCTADCPLRVDGPAVPGQSNPCQHGMTGVTGSFGPNDDAYANSHVRKAAEHIQQAMMHYCLGYMPVEYAHRKLPSNHPLVVALKALAEFDKETAMFANTVPEKTLFTPFKDRREFDALYIGIPVPSREPPYYPNQYLQEPPEPPEPTPDFPDAPRRGFPRDTTCPIKFQIKGGQRSKVFQDLMDKHLTPPPTKVEPPDFDIREIV